MSNEQGYDARRRRPNVASFQSLSKFAQAVMKGDVTAVRHSISSGEDVNQTHLDKRSLLHLACFMGRSEIVKLLLNANGIRVDSKDNKWDSPLHYACKKNHDEIVSLLLEKRCPVDSRNKEGLTPLHVCASNNSLECAKLFIDQLISSSCNVSVNCSDRSGKTALHHAACNGNCDMITFLLRWGCNSNAADSEGRKPIHFAAEVDNSDCIRILIEHGARADSRDSKNRTPLHFAARSGSQTAVQTLLDLGADMTAVDKEGNNPFHFAGNV